MTGLFRRLARQALGRPQPTVRSMARLPFQAPPEWRETDEAAVAAGAQNAPLPDDLQAVPAEAPERPVAPPAAAPDMPAARPRTGRYARAPSPTAAAPTHAIPAPVASPAARRADIEHGRAERRLPSERGPFSAPAADAPDSPGGERLGAGEAAVTAQRPTPPARPVRAAAEPSPAPLLPADTPASPARTAERRPTATAAPAARAKVPAADGAAAPAEVHIHIGRIEVTAMPEAPAPKRARKAGSAPLSLDDYLARRQRRSS